MEKSCLLMDSYFPDGDISVATCGSSLTSVQVELLKKCGAKEIIIAFDKHGENDKKEEYVKKFYSMQNKFGGAINFSFMYDKKDNYLNFKQSPIDAGKTIFLQMWEERIVL